MILGLFMLASCETTSTFSDASSGGYMGDGSRSSLQEYLRKEVGDIVYFETDKHNISASAAFKLEAQANWIKSTPGFAVIIEGHCDERGTREYNLALGEKRAQAVKNYLIGLGINPDRVSTISYGKERPAVVGSNDGAWAQNRRSVTLVN